MLAISVLCTLCLALTDLRFSYLFTLPVTDYHLLPGHIFALYKYRMHFVCPSALMTTVWFSLLGHGLRTDVWTWSASTSLTYIHTAFIDPVARERLFASVPTSFTSHTRSLVNRWLTPLFMCAPGHVRHACHDNACSDSSVAHAGEVSEKLCRENGFGARAQLCGLI